MNILSIFNNYRKKSSVIVLSLFLLIHVVEHFFYPIRLREENNELRINISRSAMAQRKESVVKKVASHVEINDTRLYTDSKKYDDLDTYTSLYRNIFEPESPPTYGLFANLSTQIGPSFFKQLQKSRKSYISGILPESLRSKSEYITILLYHPFYKHGSKDWGFGFGTRGFKKANCRIDKCNLVSDRQYLETADALVFFTPSFYSHLSVKKRFPTHNRPAYQKWIVHLMESNIYGWIDTAQYANYYNATMTFKRHSDIYTPYGHYERTDANRNYDSEVNYAIGKEIFN